MNYIIVGVKDTAILAYIQTFNCRAIGEAIRNFQDAINDPQGRMAKHADDFELYELATFDDATGKIQALPEPKQLARGKDMIIREQGITITAPQR